MLYLGNVNYKDIDFSFGFDGERLELVPRPGEKGKARALDLGLHQSGIWYHSGEGVPIESDYLELIPHNAPKELVIFPESDAFAPEPLLFRSLRVGVRAFSRSTVASRSSASGSTPPTSRSAMTTRQPSTCDMKERWRDSP